MRLGGLLALVVATACTKGGQQGSATAVPESMLPQVATTLDQGELELYLAGRDVGFERFQVVKHTSGGYGITGEALFDRDRWEYDLRYRDDWSVVELVLGKLEREGSGRECTLRLRPNEGAMEWVVERDGHELMVSREATEWAYWAVVKPAVTLTAACGKASISEQSFKNMPGVTVTLGGREPVDVAGKQLDKVIVDATYELYCDDKKLVAFRDPRNAFLTTRGEYRVFMQQLAAADRAEKPWAGDLDCPGRASDE